MIENDLNYRIKFAAQLERRTAPMRDALSFVEKFITDGGGTLELAVQHAEQEIERLRKELEQQLENDPLRVINAVLTEEAETEEERTLAEGNVEYIEAVKKQWINTFERTQQQLTYTGKPNASMEDTVLAIYGAQRPSDIGYNGHYITRRAYEDKPGQPEYFAIFPVLHPVKRPGSDRWVNDYIYPSKDYIEGVLKSLGGLALGQSLEDLNSSLPQVKWDETHLHPRGAYRVVDNFKYAAQIPTVIPGVDLMKPDTYPHIVAYLDVSAFQKALAH